MKKGLSTYAEIPTGGLDGDRTHDLLFRRQTLYPLSYKPEQLLYCTPTITRAKPLSSAQPSRHHDHIVRPITGKT